jgi:hypothetical protein
MMPTSDAADLIARLDRIQKLTDDLARCQRDTIAQMGLAERIHREILQAKQQLIPIAAVDDSAD